MSGTITFRTITTITNGKFKDTIDRGNQSITQTGLGYHAQILNVQTGTPELIPTGDVSSPGFGYFKNVYDGSRDIEIGATGASWEKMITLASGIEVGIPLSTGIQLAAMSIGSGVSELEYRIYSR